MAKRKLTTPMNYAKRLKRLEFVARNTRPELHHAIIQLNATVVDATASVVDLTYVAQGDLVTDRTGNSITLKKIVVRGITGDYGLDYYIVQSLTSSAPTYANFNSLPGGFISSVDNHTKFVEWRRWNGKQLIDNGQIIVRFPYGIRVKYAGTGAGDGVDNRFFLVVKNNLGSDYPAQLSAQITFYDN